MNTGRRQTLSHRMKRNMIDFSRVRTPGDWAAVLIGTFFGAGLLPIAPGTWGTLAAVPLTYAFHLYVPNPFHPAHLAFWLVLTLLGTWASKRVCEIMETNDHQALVIDEVVGYGICAAFAGISWSLLFVCFFIFRFFDIAKIPPIRQIDRISKVTKHSWGKGIGVMADDVMAGFQGMILFYFLAPWLIDLLQRYGIQW